MDDGEFKPLYDHPVLRYFMDWILMEEKDLLDHELLATFNRELLPVQVDVDRRLLIWPDGDRLTIAESAARIHHHHDDLEADVIERHFLYWLKMAIKPGCSSREEMMTFDKLLGKWLADYKEGKCPATNSCVILSMADYRTARLEPDA